jgi:hypothetical protein
MKLRGASRYAGPYYRLIGSVYAGEPVQAGDAVVGDGSGKRDRLFRQFADRRAGLQNVTIDEMKDFPNDPTQRKDSPPDPQLVPEERPEPEGGG